jgi:hypothetical protein
MLSVTVVLSATPASDKLGQGRGADAQGEVAGEEIENIP